MHWRIPCPGAAAQQARRRRTSTNEPELLALLHHQSPDAVIFAGPDGVIQAWNPAAESLFGFPASEAIGRDLTIIIPPPFRDAHGAACDRALAAGDTEYRGHAMPTRAFRADGSDFYIEMTFAIIHAPEGAVIGALPHARDITGRSERD